MNTLPQELVHDIISFVPEYGFMVCKDLHKPLKDIRFSFYCDTSRFVCTMSIKRAPKMNMAMDIINTFMSKYDIMFERKIDASRNGRRLKNLLSQQRHYERCNTKEDNEECTRNYMLCMEAAKGIPIRLRPSEIHDFEPFSWACDIFKKDRMTIFDKVFNKMFSKHYYEIALKTSYVGSTIHNDLIMYSHIPKANKKKLKTLLHKTFFALMAHENGLITEEKTKRMINDYGIQSGMDDFMNIITLYSRHVFFDAFVNLYCGQTTEDICRDIYADLASGSSKYTYRKMYEDNHHYKMFVSLGCRLVSEDHIKHDARLHKHYLMNITYDKVYEMTKEDLEVSFRALVDNLKQFRLY